MDAGADDDGDGATDVTVCEVPGSPLAPGSPGPATPPWSEHHPIPATTATARVMPKTERDVVELMPGTITPASDTTVRARQSGLVGPGR